MSLITFLFGPQRRIVDRQPKPYLLRPHTPSTTKRAYDESLPKLHRDVTLRRDQTFLC